MTHTGATRGLGVIFGMSGVFFLYIAGSTGRILHGRHHAFEHGADVDLLTFVPSLFLADGTSADLERGEIL